MNPKQRIVVLISAMLVMGCLLVPPWTIGGYHFIGSPPRGSINWTTMAIQLIVIGIGFGTGFILSKDE